MKVLLIGNKDRAKDINDEQLENYYSEYLDFFRKASKKSQTKPLMNFCLIDDLYIEVGDGVFNIYDTRNDVSLADYDLVLIRGGGLRERTDAVKVISSYLNYNKIKVVNDYSSFKTSSKLAQALQFYEMDIPVSKTIYVTKAITSKKYNLSIGFPCIMKAALGAHGDNNFLVKNIEEVIEISEKNKEVDFVLQRFVPNDGDFRLLVVGGDVLVIGRKATKGTHLNNTSKGGGAELTNIEDIPKKIIDSAITITKHLNMSFSGVDVIRDSTSGDYYFLEVNSQPQLMSGAFVDKKIDMIARFFDLV